MPTPEEEHLTKIIDHLQEEVRLENVLIDIQTAMFTMLAGKETPAASVAALDSKGVTVDPDEFKDKGRVGDDGSGGGGIVKLDNIIYLLATISATLLRTGGGGGGGGGHGGHGGHGGILEEEARERKDAKKKAPMTKIGRGIQKAKDTIGNIRQMGQRASAMAKKGVGKAAYGAKRVSGGSVAAAEGAEAGASASKMAGMAGKMAGVVGVVVGVGMALYDAGKAVIKWTDDALESARKLSEVSGSMAAVFAQKDIKDMQRDMQRGDATSGSANNLMNAEAERKDAAMPLMNAMDNATNNVLAWLNGAMVPFINMGTKALEMAKDMPFGIGKAFKDLTAGEEPQEMPFGIEARMMAGKAGEIEKEGQKMMEKARNAAAAPMIAR